MPRWLLWGLVRLPLCVVLWDRQVLGMALSIVTCLVMGILARWRRWQLPKPVQLKVPRPRLRLGRRRPASRDRWVSGAPLTQEMRVIDEETARAHCEGRA